MIPDDDDFEENAEEDDEDSGSDPEEFCARGTELLEDSNEDFEDDYEALDEDVTITDSGADMGEIEDDGMDLDCEEVKEGMLRLAM